MIEAVVGGHICLDIIPQFTTEWSVSAAAGREMSAYVAPNRLSEVGPAALSTGGAVSNTGINLHRLGVKTRLMGKVGDDLFGQAILDILRTYSPKLAEGMVIVPGEVSSYTIVINPPGVDRAFLHCAGANHTFSVADVRFDLLAQAQLFHFGYPPLMRRMYADGGREMAEMFARALSVGVTTSLDLTMPDPAGPSGRMDWRAVLENVLPYVTLFLPSVEEALFMMDRDRFEAIERAVGAAGMLNALDVPTIQALADRALDWGARVVLLKLGTRGLYLRTATTLGDLGRGASENLDQWGGRELWGAPFKPKKVASTVGAGDAAIAGFLAAWLRGAAPTRCLALAAAAGASCVEEAGAVRGVPTWEEIVARMGAGWERLPIKLNTPGWCWDADEDVWRGPKDCS